MSGPQGIVPESATAQVKELFVPESRVVTARHEAGQLPALDINQVCSISIVKLSLYLGCVFCCSDRHCERFNSVMM